MDAEFSHKDSWGMNDIVIGENPLDIERLMRKIYVKANHYGRRGTLLQVMSGIEVALWDILGKSANLPIYRLLGGAFRHKVAAYASCLFPPAPDKVIENAGEFVERGFRGIKFGVLAAMPQDSWIEYAISDSPLRNELCHPHFEIDSEGCISIPEAPGLGIELNEDVIKKYRIA